MASKFVVALNSLRIQMICSKEKMNLLYTWSIFNKDPELKAFLEVWDNHEKAAAILQSADANDEDDFHGLHVGSIGLNGSFTLLNKIKAQFEDLKRKLDLIVSWSVSKPLGDNELETFPNLACNYKTVPAPVPLLLTNQIISKYVKEFNELKSKVKLLKTQLNLICGCIVYKKVEDFELLEDLYNQDEATMPSTAATISFELVNDDVSTVGQSNDKSESECESESESIENFNDSESEFDNQSTGNKSYKTKSTLKSPTSKNLQCEVCHMKFNFKYPLKLKKHLLVHWGQKNHACEICEQRFTTVGNLKVHQQRHSTVKSYRCDICTKSFATAGDRKKHEIVHTGEKNYSCDVCQKSFAYLTSLRNHKIIHAKEKPHNCTQCGAKFSQMVNLKAHQLTHTGEKPHNCTVCGKDFRHRYTLILHLRTHTKEKPFECPNCNQKFSRLDSLRRHQKRQHSRM